MKKTIQIKESELIKTINLIIEQHLDSIYDDSDYAEVFYTYFRPWIKQKHGDEISEYPMSYLVKKYIEDFMKDHNIGQYYTNSRNGVHNVFNAGRYLVYIGKHKLNTLRPNQKFTEKFRKPLKFFIESLNIPNSIDLVITETNPYDVKFNFVVNWENLVMSSEKPPSPQSIATDIRKNITNYLGIDFGNPTHGELSLNIDTNNVKYVGGDEWVKNVLNKQIKKKIKELPNGGTIHRMKFEFNAGYKFGGELEIVYKSRNWGARSQVLESVKELLKSMGYNTEILKVSNN